VSELTGVAIPEVDRLLVELADRQAAQSPAPNAPRESPTDPHGLANAVVDAHWRTDRGECRLLRHHDEFLRWSGGCYQKLGDGEFCSLLTRAVQEELDLRAADGARDRDGFNFKVTKRLTADVGQSLAALVQVPDADCPPAWLRDSPPVPAHDIIALPDRLLNIEAYLSGQPTYLLEPTPDFFTLTALDFNFVPDATCQGWEDFLRQQWTDDEESIHLLQEWFGYCLAADTTLHKMLLLIGPPRSSKSTIMRILTALVGRENVSAPTFQVLQGEFGLQPLLGKQLAVITDARLSSRSNKTAIVERLLSITGEDALTVNRKNKPMVTTKLDTRIAIVTNELPDLRDASSALASRFLLLATTRSWLGQENPRLTDELLQELPGILLWSLEGLRRLRNRGHFVQPTSSREVLTELEHLSSPVRNFLDTMCVVEAGATVRCDGLFHAWQGFCQGNNLYDHGSAQFGKDLRAAVPGLRVNQQRGAFGRERQYIGVRRLRPGELSAN